MQRNQYNYTGEDFSLSVHRQPDYSVAYSYDGRGNAISIKRRGVTQTSMEQVKGADGVSRFTEFFDYGLVDDLTLSYEGNRLTKVYDAAEDPDFAGANDFVDGADEDTEYEYDVLGRLTKDKNKGITSIAYNEIGLPSDVFIAGAHIRYTYTASGELLCKAYGADVLKFLTGSPWSPGIPYVVFEADSRRDYAGAAEYQSGTLERLNHEAGWWNADGRHTAAIRDWQGSLRATWTEGDYTQTLAPPSTLFPGLTRRPRLYKNLTAYYPYGLPFADRQGTDRYLYSSKEFDRTYGLPLYDFHARTHDPQLARFLTPDPCAERYFPTSPYTYCAANPIAHTDPTGMIYQEDFSGCSAEFVNGYHERLEYAMQIPMFKHLFVLVDKSPKITTVGGQKFTNSNSSGCYKPSTSSIEYNTAKTDPPTIAVIFEEMYHAYQDAYFCNSEENKEWEAKVMTAVMQVQALEMMELDYCVEYHGNVMANEIEYLQTIINGAKKITPENINSVDCQEEYVGGGNQFRDMYKKITDNPEYTKEVQRIPKSFMYFLEKMGQ